MPDTRVLTSQNFGWFAGPASSIPAANWNNGPTLAQLRSLVNFSEALKTEGTDYNIEASEQTDSRSFVDAAGAQSRSFGQASGNIELFTPAEGDETSVYAQAWDALSHPRTRVVIGQRPVERATAIIDPGDEINLFSAMTDARTHARSDADRTLQVGLLPQGDILVGYIVPSTVPTAPAVTPSGAQTLEVGTPLFLKVAYEGRNITTGAKYVSSDESVFRVTAHGVVVPVAAGEATLTISYPGAASIAPIAIIVELP